MERLHRKGSSGRHSQGMEVNSVQLEQGMHVGEWSEMDRGLCRAPRRPAVGVFMLGAIGVQREMVRNRHETEERPESWGNASHGR